MKEVKIGLIGAGRISQDHIIGFKIAPIAFWPSCPNVQFEILADIDEKNAREKASRFGFKKATTSWQEVIADNRVDLAVITCPNNLHKAIAIGAARAGKHILCEKPLALNATQARGMLEEVSKANVKHMIGFRYRNIPAVLLSKEMIEAGKLGKIYHFRGFYLQDFAADPMQPITWRFQSQMAGSGSLGDLGSHVIDIARFLIGEFDEVVAKNETLVKKRRTDTSKNALGKVDVDDSSEFLVKFTNGATGSIVADRFAQGRKNLFGFEISGEKGSLYFQYQRMNELQFYSATDKKDEQAFKTFIIGPSHPYSKIFMSTAGHNIGLFGISAIQAYRLLKGIRDNEKISPNFFDGWKTCQVVDAVSESAQKKKWVKIT